MRSARKATAVTALAGVVLCGGFSAEASAKLPRGWPAKMHLGSWDPLGGAKKLRKKAPFRFRYQYLSGGANTRAGWRYVSRRGSFVRRFVKESARHRMMPVFTYYQLRPSLPGGRIGDEPTAVKANLDNTATMRAYYRDLRVFFKKARQTRRRMVLHVEPDVWGYAEQRAAGKVEASTVPAAVSSTGLKELRGLPNNMVGFAKAVRRLRDRYARRVLLAYHLSTWGPGVDLDHEDPPREPVDELATTAARFYRSLQTRFDVVFTEFGNRDAAFRLVVFGDSEPWWYRDDYGRHRQFLGTFSRVSGRRLVLWRIPLGNTFMRAQNNTWGHYQDNRVQWLLTNRRYRHLRQYRAAGVIGAIFGGGAPGTTCSCDFRRDGVTNPRPINGNRRRSRSKDDDGGYFRARSRAYYRRGALGLRR